MNAYQLWNEDCVQGMPHRLDADAVDLVVTSIPFGALFAYSAKTEDIGNNPDGTDMRASMFGLHMRFFVEQLVRVMKPGTIAAIHIQQLLTTKVQHGYMGRRDFRGAVVDLFAAADLVWRGEICIPKNPQVIAQRTGLHSLKFETGRKDGRRLAPYVNDFVMIFQKPGEAVPVPCLYDLARNPGGWVTTAEWIRDAHGVWTDIRETDVLQDGQDQQSRAKAARVAAGREEEDERHVCPLQLEVIRRLVKLYSNPGETVFDPFMGIGSTGYVALEQGRLTRGFELKSSYFEIAIKNCQRALESRQREVMPPEEMPMLAAIERASVA